MSAPALVIVVELEEPVRLYVDCPTDEQARRLDAWVRSVPAVDALVQRAAELAETTRAA